MFSGKMIKKLTGSLLALFGVALMIGVAGGVEAGSISIGSALFRMTFGILLVFNGAMMHGGVE